MMGKTKAMSFAEAVDEFKKVQEKHADFGAWDTEPDTEFQLVIRHLYEGDDPTGTLPRTARDWQLFSDMPGVDVAAKALHDAALAVVEAGKRDSLALARYAKTELWRA